MFSWDLERVRMREGPEFYSINSVECLFLREIAEPRDNSLRITVDEAIGNRSKASPMNIPGLEYLGKDSWPIESTENCVRFELSWKYVMAYLVTEECTGSCGEYDDEIYTGKLLRVYSKSHFLEHIARDTGAHTEPIMHHKLVCLNHLIDVASYATPEIRILGSAKIPHSSD
jgi:hypothetical protein